MPNCIGSIDGKHCRIQCPPNAGSLFYCYKDFHSVVLLAVADANACFTMIEVGAFGKENDSTIFATSTMGKAFNAHQLDVPHGKFPLPGSQNETEMYLVGDEAFPLQQNLMRPFPRRDLDFSKRNFNFRLSRARKSVECAFGILSKKFEIFQSSIKTDISQADMTIKCACVLHNFIKKQQNPRDFILDQELFPWNEENRQSLPPTSQRRGTNEAVATRNLLKDYFLSSAGFLPWQNWTKTLNNWLVTFGSLFLKYYWLVLKLSYVNVIKSNSNYFKFTLRWSDKKLWFRNLFIQIS